MKKLFSILLSLCMLLGFVGCAGPKVDYVYAPNELYAVVEDNLGNEYTIDISREEGKTVKKIDYDIEYLARYDTQVYLYLKGIYQKGGTPLAKEFYQSGVEDDNSVFLAYVGTYEIPKACYIYYLANGYKQNDYEVKFRFNITVKADKTLHKYVTIPDAEIPYDYFACEMQEISADTYDLSAFQYILGCNNTDDYEYGELSQHFSSESADAEMLNYSSEIIKRQAKGDIVWQTEMFHSVEFVGNVGWEIYQYTQFKGEDPYELNPAYLLNETDGIFSASTHKQSGYRGWSNYLPTELEVVKEGADLKYKMGVKDGYLYLSISGILQNFWYPDPTVITATYKIQDNKIVAWLFATKEVSADEYGYWTTAKYCIPLSGDIELLAEAVLEELCAVY